VGVNDGKTPQFLIREPDDGAEEGGKVIDMAAVGEDAFKDIIGEGGE
jgi:hypothetical protein